MTSRRDKDKDQHTKKVHYTSSTKGSTTHTHRSRHSHDSGLGTSSDRASLGTSPSSPTYAETSMQRHNLASVTEALSAANEKIKMLEQIQQDLNEMLAEQNRDNKALKKERAVLVIENEALNRELSEERRTSERLRRERDAALGKGLPVGEKEETRMGSREREKEEKKRREDERKQSEKDRKKRDSWKDMPVPLYQDSRRREDEYAYTRPPSAPHPPHTSNPFMPNPTLNPSYSGRTMPPSSIAYAPTTISYSTAPVFEEARGSMMGRELDRYDDGQFPVDGNYHPYPL